MKDSTKQRIQEFLNNSDYVAELLTKAMEAADVACDLTEDETTELWEGTEWAIQISWKDEPKYPWTDPTIPNDKIDGESS